MVHGRNETPLILARRVALRSVLPQMAVKTPHSVDTTLQHRHTDVTPADDTTCDVDIIHTARGCEISIERTEGARDVGR